MFVLDDKYAILDNPNIRSLWPLTHAMSAPPENPVSGRPVAALTLAINYALASDGGLNVWGYHFLNLGLHVLTALALFGVVRRTLSSDRLRLRFGSHSTVLAFAASLVWLVHPMLTDAVTYVAQRTEVLMGLFYLLTLYCAIRAGERGIDRRRRRWWTAGAVVACALGMGSKQAMISAPLVVWLWDWMFEMEAAAPERGSPSPEPRAPSAGRRRWILYAGLAATWVILGALVAHERWPTSVGFNLEGWTPWAYLLTQTGVLVHYLRLAVVPSPLVLDYQGWPMARSVLDVLPHAALLTALFAATVVAVVRRQPWGFVGAWFFAILAPSSSLLPLPTEIAAERRMYLPLAGVVVVVIVAGYAIGQRLLARFVADERSRRRAGSIAAAALVGAVVITFASMTSARNRDFWSDERLWQDTVEKRPGNWRARMNYGVDLVQTQRYAEAEPHLREAVRLKDTSAASHANLGALLCRLGRLDEGIPHLERAIALDREYTDAYANLGEAHGALGRRALAARYFALAVTASPDSPFLLSRLGWLLATSPEDAVRDGAKAVEVSERAVRITSHRDVMSLDTLAAAYAEVGRFEEAVATAREALTLAEQRGDRATAVELTDRVARYGSRQRVREK